MILDSSAIVAVVFKEPGFEALVDKIVTQPPVAIGGPTVAEAGLVLTARLGRDASGMLARLLAEWDAAIVPFGDEHWRAAVSAYSRYGKGRHRAALNFGDCLSYAVAKLSGEPLLCVGQDFSKTDLDLI